MKKNILFLIEKLGVLACVIFMASAFGQILHKELDRHYTDASLHYMFIIIFFSCVIFLIFVAFYVTHLIASRDYKYYSKKK